MIHQLYRHKLVAKSAAALVMVGAFASMGLITEANAATFTVNSTVDSVECNPGNGICADASGNRTLKAAIMEANALAGADTINLAAGVNYIMIAADNSACVFGSSSGLPLITSNITINGNGATILRSSATGTPAFRLFCVVDTGDLTLKDVTISGGSTSGGGGGLYNQGATTIIRSTISGNQGGDGLSGSPGGGGIFNFVNGKLMIVNSTISGNKSLSGYGGGGILNFSSYSHATTTVIGSTIAENIADGLPGFRGRGDAVADAFSPAGSIVVKNSILASPTQGMGNDCYINGSVLTSLGNNIASDNSCGLTGSGDRNGIDPLLGP